MNIKSKKGVVVRVTGLPQPDNTTTDSQLKETLEQALRDREPDAEANAQYWADNLRVEFVPSCHDEAERVALIEFNNGLPDFLSSSDPLGEMSLEMNDSYLSMDRHFHGFTQLYTPKSTDLVTADVIAITGLDGHAYGSWRSKTQGTMWLRHFLAKDMPRCRTMIYGYNSKLSEPGFGDIMDYASGLLEEIRKIRYSPKLRQRPLIFIAHSFGGLILAQALLTASTTLEKDDPATATLKSATYGMLLFSIPHSGLLVDDMKAMLSARQNDLRLPLVDSIESGSFPLKLIRENFRNLIDRAGYKLVSFYETRGTPRLEFVPTKGIFTRSGKHLIALDRSSALLHLPESKERNIGLDADHSMIVKFDSIGTPGYTSARAYLRQFEKEALNIVAEDSCIRLLSLQNMQQENNKILQEFRKLLQFPFMGARRDELVSHRDDYTSTWTGHEIVDSWITASSLSDVSQTLFLAGKAGSGKSVLSFSAFEKAVYNSKSTNGIINLGYFFDAKKEGFLGFHNSHEAMLRSFLLQLIEKSVSLPVVTLHSRLAEYLEIIRTAAQEKEQRDSIPHSEPVPKKPASGQRKVDGDYAQENSKLEDPIWVARLQDCVKSLIEGLGLNAQNGGFHIRMFVDALDECDPSAATKVVKFLEQITTAGQSHRVRVHLCLSYRNGYEGLFNSWKDNELALSRIQVDAHNSEAIRQLVCRKLENYCSINIGALCTQLISKASGVFLWIRLVIEAILRQVPEECDPDELELVVQSMPEGLDDIYTQMLKPRSTKIPFAETLATLQIVLHSRKPFTTSELKAALLLQGFKCNVNPVALFMTRIEKSCRGLVEFHKSDGVEPTLHLIHETARSFLLGENGIEALAKNFPDINADFEGHSHLVLLRLCLIVFAEDDFTEKEDFEQSATLKKSARHLRQYAVDAWLHHGWACDTHLESCADRHGLTLIRYCEAKATELHRYCMASLRSKELWHWVQTSTTVLVLMAMSGCTQLLNIHIGAGCICRKDSEECLLGLKSVWSAMLYQAARGGHLRLVHLCKDMGGDINVQVPHYNDTPLFVACEQGHTEVVEYILENGGLSDVMGMCHAPEQTPFLVAAAGGHSETMQAIIRAVAPEQIPILLDLRTGKDRRSALHLAASFNHFESVRYLIDLMHTHRVDINITTRSSDLHPRGLTALAWALQRKVKGEVTDLLKRHGCST